MKKIISILLMLFTVSLSAREQRFVIFDLVDTVKKPAGCELVGESAYGVKFKENYRTANNDKFRKGEVVSVQRKYVIFSAKTECPSFDRTRIFYADGYKTVCEITKVVKEVDTYEASLLQAVGNCIQAKKKVNLKELREVEEFLKSYGD